MKKTRCEVLEDATIVAYLAIRGYHFKPVKRNDGRIVFEILGDISKPLDELYTDPPIPALSFIKELKSVRSSIYSMRLRGE
jgi:hypothetical protein